MTIWVVRHGCAGDKDAWTGDDDARPLDAIGREQARAIADRLAPRGPTRLWASPTRRCVDTLAPLADRPGLAVLTTDELRPGGWPDGLLGWLETHAGPGDVICSHGEAMRPALGDLRSRGAAPTGHDDDALVAKGVVWELEIAPLALVAHDVVPTTCPDHRR
jgi:phosphohistidine phosphatase SixA